LLLREIRELAFGTGRHRRLGWYRLGRKLREQRPDLQHVLDLGCGFRDPVPSWLRAGGPAHSAWPWTTIPRRPSARKRTWDASHVSSSSCKPGLLRAWARRSTWLMANIQADVLTCAGHRASSPNLARSTAGFILSGLLLEQVEPLLAILRDAVWADARAEEGEWGALCLRFLTGCGGNHRFYGHACSFPAQLLDGERVTLDRPVENTWSRSSGLQVGAEGLRSSTGPQL